MLRPQRVAGVSPDFTAKALRALTLLTDVFALAGTQRLQKGTEIGVIVVEPVELLT